MYVNIQAFNIICVMLMCVCVYMHVQMYNEYYNMCTLVPVTILVNYLPVIRLTIH